MSNRITEIDIGQREKLILVGLYLSKYDQRGLERLGFGSFMEAYNIIGFALGAKPASIKNYRDEFDPVFPSQRKGWHKRRVRDYCAEILERYKDLGFDAFTGLVSSFFEGDGSAPVAAFYEEQPDETESSFAQRLLTGLAAEHYFEIVRLEVPAFKDYIVENTTRLGCGYDFRLSTHSHDQEFLAVEVKGLKEQCGSISMTPKEHAAASRLANRFFLFVVRNFRESPSHDIYQNPLSGELLFRKKERTVIQVSWQTSV